MTQQEYFPYIRDVHGALSKAQPVTVRRYVQNHSFDGAFGSATDTVYQIVFHRDSVTELWFDSLESMGETFAHPHVREKIGPDGANFSDLSTALAVLTREVELTVPHGRANAPVKVLYFLRKTADISLDDCFRLWASAHESAMQADPQAAAALRRCVCSQQIPEGNRFLGYFGGKDMPIYEAVVSLWYDESEALRAFRAYQRALEARNRQGRFFDPSQSFFLMVREVLIIA
jgi:hypothetical protein